MERLSVRRYRLYPLVVVCAVLFGLSWLNGLIAPLYGLALSMVKYDFMRGFWSSEWVGLANYRYLLSQDGFGAAIGNSALMWAIQHAAGVALGIPLALVVAAPRKNAYSAALCALMFLPLAVPEVSWFELVSAMVPGICAVPDRYRLAFMLQTVVPTAALVALSGGAFRLAMERFSAVWKGVGAAALIFALTALSPSVRAAYLGYSAAVRSAAEAMSTYVYQLGLVNAQFSPAAAASWLKAAIQFAVALPAAIALGFVVRPGRAQTVLERGGFRFGAFAMALGIALAASAAAVVLSSVGSGVGKGDDASTLYGATGVSAGLAVGAAVSGFLLAAGAFYGMKALRGWGLAVFGLLFLTLSDHLVAEYTLMRSVGLVNTQLPALMSAAYKPEALTLLLLLCAAFMYVQPTWKHLALAGAVALVIGASAAGDYWVNSIYVSSPAQWNLGVVSYEGMRYLDGVSRASISRPMLTICLTCGCGAVALGAFGLSSEAE